MKHFIVETNSNYNKNSNKYTKQNTLEKINMPYLYKKVTYRAENVQII